jgi:hypothetical protein
MNELSDEEIRSRNASIRVFYFDSSFVHESDLILLLGWVCLVVFHCTRKAL